jgi:Phage gp6-like head-tail connector protein
MDSIIKIITPATSYDFMTLEEIKDALGIADTDTSQDAELQKQITMMSDIIAVQCNRSNLDGHSFGKEKVQETWRELDSRRVYLSHWPVKADDIESVECPRGSTPSLGYPTNDPGWELEEQSGKLSLFAGQSEPISVIYTGGYDLPDEAPPALKASCEILIRSWRIWNQRQLTSGIRSISHKDARVMFFDPNVLMKQTGSTPLATAGQTVKDLLYHYMRFWV